jgi:hypothetical protein
MRLGGQATRQGQEQEQQGNEVTHGPTSDRRRTGSRAGRKLAPASGLDGARPRPLARAGVYLHRLADGRVDELGQLSAAASMDEPDEVAEEGRVDPLAALVGGNPGQFEEFVDLRLGKVERGGILTGRGGYPVARG